MRMNRKKIADKLTNSVHTAHVELRDDDEVELVRDDDDVELVLEYAGPVDQLLPTAVDSLNLSQEHAHRSGNLNKLSNVITSTQSSLPTQG